MGAHRADDFVRDPREMDGEALGFGFQENPEQEFADADNVGWGKEGSGRHTLVVNGVWHEKRKTHKRPIQRCHELFHMGAGRATGTRMAMRTIWPVLHWGQSNGSCPLSCRQRSR